MNFSAMDLDSVRELAEKNPLALEFIRRYGFTE